MSFGVPTSFGLFQTSGNSPFGVSTTSSGFGTGFGQPSSSATHTMFGVPVNTSPFGVTTPSSFGIWQTTGNTTMSINEQDSPADKIASISSLYNHKSHEELRSDDYGNIKGSRRLPYSATRAQEEIKGVDISILLNSISAMQCYKNKSHEELRMEDYEERAKGVQSPWGNKASEPSGAPVNIFSRPQGSHPFTPFNTTSTNNPFSRSTNPFTPQITTTTTTPTPTISPNPFFPKNNPFTTTQPANPFAPSTNPFSVAPQTPTINTTPTPSISPNPFFPKNSPFTTTQPTNPFSPSTNTFPFAPQAPTMNTTPTPSISPSPFSVTQPTNPFSPSTSLFPFAPQTATISTTPTPSISPFATTTTTQPTNPFSPSTNLFPFTPPPQTPTTNTTPTPSISPFTTATQPTNPFSPSTNMFPFAPQSQIPTTSTTPQNNNPFSMPPFTNPFPQSQPFMTPTNSVIRASTPATKSDSIFHSNATNIFGPLVTTPSVPSPQPNPFAPSQPFSVNISQPGLTCTTTQSQPFQIFTSVVQPEAVTSTRHGISSLPVKNNSAPVRMSSSYRIRHLSSRRGSLPAHRYKPESCVSKVPFFGDKEYKPCLVAPFLPRENPRAWVLNKASEPKDAPIDVYKEQGETCEDKAGAKSCFLVNADLCLADDTVASSLMPKLPCGGEYYTEPSIKELEEKERAEPGFCSRVKNFVVGRKDKGNIVFLGETDIRHLDLESIVQFNDREVIVYKDEENKPPVGQGLNRPAEVTLLNVKFLSKTSGKQLSDDGHRKMEKMVMKKTNEQGAEFVSYNPVSGEWKFRVKHF